MADRVVIMSRGKFEQIGTPREIYRTPRTRFVAEFLGSSNLFSGKIVGTEQGLALETDAGRFALQPGATDRQGRDVMLMVLDTKTQLSVEPPQLMTNAVPVRVIGEEFVGATATLYLETAQGKEIRVQKGHDEIAGLPTDIGQQLYAWWNPQDGHVIAEA